MNDALPDIHFPGHDKLVAALDKTAVGQGDLSVVANVDARVHGGGDEWRGLLARQLTSPVRWSASVVTLASELQCDQLVEIGPGKTLSGMVKRIAPDIRTANVGDLAGLDTAVGIIRGVATVPASV